MSKKTAILIVALGAIILSLEGLFLRNIELANGYQILVFRSISVFIIFALMSIITNLKISSTFNISITISDLLAAICLSIAFMCFVFSMLLTSVASTLLILSIAPIVSVILSIPILGERPSKIFYPIVLFIIIGVYIMINGNIGYSNILGNIIALIGATCFALTIIFSRKSLNKNNFIGGTMAGLITLIVAIFLCIYKGFDLIINTNDMIIILCMGLVSTGLGMTMVINGARHLAAPEVSLIVLLETVFGPVWTWLFVNEIIKKSELLGGLIILSSLLIYFYLKLKSKVS